MRTYLLSHLLDARAAESGGRPALELDAATTTYAELAETAGRLAATLRGAGLGHRDRIGIYLPKSLASYTGIFATLEIGAAYVPLDPSAPAARIRYTAGDCGLRALITTAGLATALLEEGELDALELVIVAGDKDVPLARLRRDLPDLPAGITGLSWQQALDTRPGASINPAIEQDLAYILYTSGSTGRPKGVMVSHRGALGFVEWGVEALELTRDDRVAAVAAQHFDLSVFDLFATVAAGATLVPLPEGIMLKPRELTAWIAEQEISVWYSTPSTLILLLEEGGLDTRDYPHLRCILFAGEVFPTKHLRHLRRAVPGARLANLYGPTETNVCTWHPVDELPADDRETIPIGRACANTEVKALDDAGAEVAEGEEGELWVRGPTVMLGYWGDAEKTAASLRALSVAPEGRQRKEYGPGFWYRTGDLVHRDDAGDYHFHGRRDHMVKVRGYRVELGEVEAALYTHPNIRELAVVAVPANGHGKKLRAYIVPHDPDKHSVIQLKAHLGQQLPAYMIPAEMECLEALPKTSTGKVDRQALASAATT